MTAPLIVIFQTIHVPEYFDFGKDKSIVTILFLAVSIVSSNTLLGVPAEAYGFGAQYALIGIGSTVAGFVIAFTFVPLIYPLHITSIHQVKFYL